MAHNWNYGILGTPARTIVKTRLKTLRIRGYDQRIVGQPSSYFRLDFCKFKKSLRDLSKYSPGVGVVLSTGAVLLQKKLAPGQGF